MGWTLPAWPWAALLVVATNSAAVLSANRPAASSAFAAGCEFLSSFTENFGSINATSAAFWAFSVSAGAFVTAATGITAAAAMFVEAGAAGLAATCVRGRAEDVW